MDDGSDDEGSMNKHLLSSFLLTKQLSVFVNCFLCHVVKFMCS